MEAEMSGTDAYRPSKRIEVVQVHQEFVNVPVRNYVGAEHDEKRAAASARVLRNQDIAEQDWREQVQDATYAPAYTGPVGTKRERERMPSREEVEDSSTIIEHKQPQDTRLVKAEKALAARKARQARMREDEMREREMRALGFGGRTGVHL